MNQGPLTKAANAPHDRGYETRAVALLASGFGLVGLDRFIINPLYPVMSRDLHLDYQQFGLVSGVLALAWGIAAVFTGRLADRIGRKRVLVPAAVAFSLLVAISGLAIGFGTLLIVRALMGFAEGAFLPASIVATTEASKPSRIGLNIGIQQMAAPLVGLGLGPLLAVTALKFMSWRYIFALIAIPGLILAYLMARTLRERPKLRQDAQQSAPASWRSVLRYRNVVFNTLGMFCWLSCLIVLSAFLPAYLTDYLHLSLQQMGGVLAGVGIGSFLGMVALPAASDFTARKPVVLFALGIELLFLWLLPSIGPEPTKLFFTLFTITFMNAGVVSITVGPLTSEAVPPALSATATGLVVGLGEIVGGALAPALAGIVAQRAGIAHILQIALIAIALGFVIAWFGIREPSGSAGLRARATPQEVKT